MLITLHFGRRKPKLSPWYSALLTRRGRFARRLLNGGQYLFQAKDDDEMNSWVAKLQQFTDPEGAGPSRAQTLPAHATKDEPKKRGFFTLKK